MKSNRNTPLPITPHTILEQKCAGLRDCISPPPTYRLYKRQPDGSEIFLGEKPTPIVDYRNLRRNKA